jgi:hypothetical protein
MTSSLQNVFRKSFKTCIGRLLSCKFPLTYLINIILPLHRFVARNISPGAPACRDSVRTKFSLQKLNSAGEIQPFSCASLICRYAAFGSLCQASLRGFDRRRQGSRSMFARLVLVFLKAVSFACCSYKQRTPIDLAQ